MKHSLSKAWLQYEAGKEYKRRIGLYCTVRENERFYRGDQWHMIESKNLPRPVFNIVRRVVDYLTCSVTPEKVSIRYVDEKSPYNNEVDRERAERITSILSANACYRWEKNGMDSKLYDLVNNAAITGDGVLYSYWKSDAAGDGSFEGDIVTEVVDNVNLFVADMNKRDIQSQEYIILSGRASVASLKKEAREGGASERDVLKIVADSPDDGERSGDFSSLELKGDDEEKATYIIKFWKEDGRVLFEKSTRECVISRVKTPCTLYPVAYFNWFTSKNCFHGTSVVSGMVPNQKYINRAYAMVMKHMSDTAFSKVIYDKSKIPEWSNEVGEAIAAHSGTNVSDAVAVLGVGKLQEGYLDFLANVISTTKELSNATETALGNVTPQNTSAIIAIKESAKVPLKLVRAALYRCIEDLANIWSDMALAYYASDRLVPMLDKDGKYSSCALLLEKNEKILPRAFVDVVDSSAYSSAITVSILDKLLDSGKISVEQYLKLIPSECVDNAELFKEVQYE